MLSDQGRRLIVVVGPSGAGKDSLLRAWLQALPATQRPHRAQRCITRPADPHEDHEARDEAAFDRLLQAGAFALHWQAHGLRYGVRHVELAALEQGGWVVLNGSRRHLPQLLLQAPGLRLVEVSASPALCAARLHQRGREAEHQRSSRLQGTAPAPLRDPDLRVLNETDLASAVAPLRAWWQALVDDEAQATVQTNAQAGVLA